MNLKKERIKKTLNTLEYCIATDKYNLLRDNDNIILYFFKKLYYKIKLFFKYRRLIKWVKIYKRYNG